MQRRPTPVGVLSPFVQTVLHAMRSTEVWSLKLAMIRDRSKLVAVAAAGADRFPFVIFY
jgi:hypothetical protein